ncbi:endonuclease MutS2 [Paucilactobacillus suebicus]|uniref:Endonuclease MutS2 n=1 Tax=Paucilactobacillus suebicus DSM 5007 = KCTC 3549 TaxID=1423807 RepID=A0A0R1WCW1_9LACO|nr:endonuclease MutS2 [Paucilactobacillus suebicus]KRM13449.1 MutS2 family protein [Paucilactobacillus suebicus DSM 5007 = KCTC 3549]
MNKKILETMEFDRIKDQIAPYLVSAAGKKELASLTPASDYETVNELLGETTASVEILRLNGGMPIPQLSDISEQLKRLKIKATLNGTELAQIARVLRASASTKDFFEKLRQQEIDIKAVEHYVDELVTIPSITKQLVSSVEDDGRLKDEASTKLHGLREKITQTEALIRQRMENYTRGKESKYLSDSIVTMRNDRYVLPVQANYRNHFGGVVHDQSQSGLTLFIEPQAVMELNNRLREAQIDERHEERRILAELSSTLAPYRIEIAHNETILGHLDFLNAKAAIAHEMNATKPIVSEQNHVNLKRARHPLIDPKKMVANDIEIGDAYKAIIITGPNTGGKTITLKTIGLIQLMGQSGLYIPTEEESSIGVFGDIFADIGDEQSLEQNLSTFSGHMENVKSILDHIDSRSLVLLDELGAGTDPKEGAALAMSILDAIGVKNSYVMVTTHYPELKVYGYDRDQTINASMEFDQETLQPTYRLLLGIPGRSNAFEIAQRLGISSEIISEARSLTDDDSQDLNKMIGDLVEQRKKAHEHELELEHQVADATDLQTELRQKLDQFEANRDQMQDQARVQANHEVAQARQKADQIISHLRQLERQQGANVKENQLIDAKGQLNALHMNDPKLKKNKVLQREKRKHDLKVGDAVLVKSYGQYGELTRKMGKDDWEVQLGILKMKVNESDLERTDRKNISEQEAKQPKRPMVRTQQTRQTSARLDLRGHRYEAAMNEVEQFIDHAILNNLPSVTIIHGKGTGALRKGTHEYLQSNPRVKSFEYAAPNAGGDGATIVFL